MSKFAFIGAGNMGGAMLRSLCRAVPSENVYVYDAYAPNSARAAEDTGCIACGTSQEAVKAAKYVFFCVKPQILRSVIEDVSGTVKTALDAGEEKIAVSIAAGFSIEAIADAFAKYGVTVPIIRIMPNLAASIGMGLLLLTCGGGVKDEDCAELMDALRECGIVEKTSERLVSRGTAISGSGPAFAYMFIEALADGGVEIGLPRDKALLYAAQTVMGAAGMVLETGRHPGELKDAVCSPGGTSIAGVLELEKGAFRHSAASAVSAAWERYKQLG